MSTKRRCGIICHPTSLPGRFGIGELGQAAYRLVDFLVQAGQTIWQILPLGPTGYGDSPYQPFSAFAGNPLLIDLESLVAEGLLTEEELTLEEPFPAHRVDYGRVIAFKHRVLRRSYRHFQEHAAPALRDALAAFQQEQRSWLEDYALFMALKLHFDWAVWTEWPADIALREPRAVHTWRETLRDEIAYHVYLQFLFWRQWRAVRHYANQAGVLIMGDAPIFMAHDSADVWSHRELFYLDDHGRPTVVAGVPPDYFSATGQLWGNPLYRWDVMREDNYAWWMDRLRTVFAQVDLVRLDHFRGFAGYWEIPAHETTAINGRWVKGPGAHFLRAAEQALGKLPIIAEDLGLITPDVDALRKAFGFPGMRVLHFAFDDDASSPHLPHNYPTDCVAYTGTHDNDTTLGWYAAQTERAKHRFRVYTGTDGSSPHWALIRLAMMSVADTAVYPLQDVLGLGSEARMNLPGRPDGNWSWRYTPEMLQSWQADLLREMATVAGRWSPPGEEPAEAFAPPIAYEEP